MNDFAETLNASLAALFSGTVGRVISHRPIRVDKYYESAYEISCHMSFFDVSGKNAGVALLNINKGDLIEMWKDVLGMPMPDDADATEIATELVNMIVGNASAKLSAQGHKIRIALPQIIDCSHQIRLSTMKRDDFHYFEFSDESLRFNWVLCFYEVIGFAT
jgi:CheY-specific phosphatase CheX